MTTRTQGFTMKKTTVFFPHLNNHYSNDIQTDRIIHIERIQEATKQWSSEIINHELRAYPCMLNKLESEQLQQMCIDYMKQKCVHSIFENEAYLMKYISSWALLTTLPVICTLLMTALLGLNPSEAPELAQVLIAIGMIPLFIGVYGKAVFSYNQALKNHCALKIEYIAKKTLQ